MTADVEQPEAQDLSDEERILQCIEQHYESGISTFAITSELHLSARTISPIIDRLESEKKLHGEKRGFIYYWFPGPPQSSEGDEEAAAWDRITDDKYKEAPKDAKPEEGTKAKRMGGRPPKDPNVPRVPCPIDDCGLMLAMTRDNVGHHLSRKHKLSKVETRAYLDKMFPKPDGEHAEAPADLVPEPETQAQGDLVKDTDKEVGRISNDAPPGHLVEDTLKKEEETSFDDDGCTIAMPCQPTLAEFARKHSISAGREISKLKRIERRMRRRAAAAEAMAERVRYARQIKERELRRFEHELAEIVRGER